MPDESIHPSPNYLTLTHTIPHPMVMQFRSDCDWGRVFEGAIQFRKQHLVHIERAVSEGDESFVR
jgi:hypothetical protein